MIIRQNAEADCLFLFTEITEERKMSNILSTWKTERINYQRRYAEHVLKYDENPNDETNRGAMLEASYILINILD